MPRATKEEAERTAQRILDVATDHFRDTGYAEANLMAIAGEAGVTRGAIYHHYPNKLALFAAVVGRLHEQVQEQIEAAAANFESLWDQLIVGCEAFIDAAIDPAVRQILLIEAPAVLGWETWRSLDERTSFASLTDVLQQLEATGEIRSGSADATARLLSGAMNEAVLWIASSADPTAARTQAWDALTTMLHSVRRIT